MKKIIDVMNTNLITITKETDFEEILKLMQTKKIGRLPVVENGRVLGVVTRDDILVREEKAPIPPIIAFWDLLITLPQTKDFQEKLKKISSFAAKDLMSTDFLKVTAEDKLEDIVTKMLEEDYPYALVIEGETLKGIVTKSDLINNCF